MGVRPDRELYETLRQRLRRDGLTARSWTGLEADQVVRRLAPLIEEELRREMARVNPDEALQWSATWLAHTIEAREEARIVGDPFGARDLSRTAVLTPEVFTARLAFETAVRNRATGVHRLDARHEYNLDVLARNALELAMRADRIAFGLCRATAVELRRDGRIDVEIEDRPPFRQSAYLQERLRYTGRAEPEAPDDALAAALMESVHRGGPPPMELAGVSNALASERGHDLVQLFVALCSLEEMAGMNDERVVARAIPRDDVIANFTAHVDVNHPEHDPQEVAAALPWLTWDQRSVQASSTASVLEYRETPQRLISRPLVELPDGRHILVRGVCHQAKLTYMMRVLEGTWVERLPETGGPLEKALESRRRDVRPTDEFERQVAACLRALGYPHAVAVGQSRKGKTSRIGVPLSQEVDAVVVDERFGLIWVIEAKDFAIPYSSRRIRSELDKYLRPRGLCDKLTTKCAEVDVDPAAVAAALGAKAMDYSVGGLFVTRAPSPTSCHDDRRHGFVLMQQLTDFFRFGDTLR